MLRYFTAGESHGKALSAIIEGYPSNIPISLDYINQELARRQQGYGRGGRMKIEKDKAEILSGVRFGKTLGSPISILVKNKDWQNWEQKMASFDPPPDDLEEITVARPGHADYAGAIKYQHKDIRNILERASARSTAVRVAVGAFAKILLQHFNIEITSKIIEIGGQSVQRLKQTVDQAKEKGDSLGGIFELQIANVPVGLGSHVHYDRKLDAALAAAIISIQAIKGVEFGLGFESARRFGSEVHDVFAIKNEKIFRETNNAGGIEGGISNGQPIIIRAAMKPIPTMMNPLPSIDLDTNQQTQAHVERADVCAIEAATVVAESVVAFVTAKFFLEKYGGDSLQEIQKHFASKGYKSFQSKK